MEEQLKKIGMTAVEASIYTSLFELGSATAAKIAEKNSIHRTNAYDYLSRLIKQGLVSCTTKEGVKYYNATDPNNLLSLFEKRKEEIDNEKKQLISTINKLRKLKPSESVGSRIETFQDNEGLASFYEKLLDIAASKDEVLVIGTSERITEIFNYYLLNLTKKIGDINIKVKMIANKDIMKDKYMKIISKMIVLKIRYVPLEHLSPAAVFIFKDYVGFCNFMKNPFVILVNDRAVAASYKKHFDFAWGSASSQ